MRTERLYKASKRRRQVFLKKLAIVFSVIVIAAGLGITMGSNFTGSNQVSAHDKDIVEKEKYYNRGITKMRRKRRIWIFAVVIHCGILQKNIWTTTMAACRIILMR